MVLMMVPFWWLMLFHWTPTRSAGAYAPLQFIPIFVALSYATLAGQSLGKKRMGLTILTRSGETPRAAQLIVRFFAKFPSVALITLWAASSVLRRSPISESYQATLVCAFVLSLSAWPVLTFLLPFTRFGNTLHDMVAGTMVCEMWQPRGFSVEPTSVQKLQSKRPENPPTGDDISSRR